MNPLLKTLAVGVATKVLANPAARRKIKELNTPQNRAKAMDAFSKLNAKKK